MTVDKERLREVALAAPAGPWSVDRYRKSKRRRASIVGADGYVIRSADIEEYLAVASPDVVLALLDENAALRRLALEACGIGRAALRSEGLEEGGQRKRLEVVREEVERG